ncbi:RnfABCDGE type electron transport complex subunit G [bacterium]|nr:RnfABCDGE type electron transport complex subunit G [bacterium]
MKDIPHFALVLTVVACFSAGSLAWLNTITRPRIIAQQQQELDAGIMQVLPGSENGVIKAVENDGTVSFYKGYRNADSTSLIGYAFLIAPQGYSSNIRTIVGIDSSCSRVLSIKVLSQKETPGLGTKCEEIRSGETAPWFQEQFRNKPYADLILDKDGGTIESITGATITSRAIMLGVASRMELLRDELDIPNTMIN